MQLGTFITIDDNNNPAPLLGFSCRSYQAVLYSPPMWVTYLCHFDGFARNLILQVFNRFSRQCGGIVVFLQLLLIDKVGLPHTSHNPCLTKWLCNLFPPEQT
jgi:hypothetical protein